jgi:hypothetical protein
MIRRQQCLRALSFPSGFTRFTVAAAGQWQKTQNADNPCNFALLRQRISLPGRTRPALCGHFAALAVGKPNSHPHSLSDNVLNTFDLGGAN